MRTAGRCATYTAGMELWSWLAMAGVGVVGYLLGWAGGARNARRPVLPPAPPSGRSIAPPAEVGLEIHDEQRAEIGRLLAQGRKIEAIKRYREATGLGLKESKDAIDYWELRGEAIDPGTEGQWPQLPPGPGR